MGFKVGERVVCVDDDPDKYLNTKRFKVESNDMDGLVKGAIYTIRGVRYNDEACIGKVSVFLQEIIRPIDYDGIECSFAAQRFRPLVETNIDIFQAMLVNPHREVELT